MATVVQTTAPGTNVGFMSNAEVLERRQDLGFVRAFDGKVALQAAQDELWDVKLDLNSPGTLLLRSPEGLVHYLALSSVSQIDLSDDEVVGALATNNWKAGVHAIEEVDEQKEMHRLELTREGFYNLISVVDP